MELPKKKNEWWRLMKVSLFGAVGVGIAGIWMWEVKLGLTAVVLMLATLAFAMIADLSEDEE